MKIRVVVDVNIWLSFCIGQMLDELPIWLHFLLWNFSLVLN